MLRVSIVRALFLCFLFLFVFIGCEQRHPSGETSGTLGTASVKTSRPSVVWILLDACRADHLSAYGYPRETSPNIDALAARGVLFERNFSQGPNTPQSMRNFMTGRYDAVSYTYPGAMGEWFLREPPPNERLISTIFRENNYTTAMFSASPWYVAGSRLAASFDEYVPLRHDEALTGDTYRERHPALFQWLSDHADEPFLLYVHSLDTHGPRYHNNTDPRWLDASFDPARDARLRSWDALLQAGPQTFSPEDIAHLANLYDGGIAYADSAVGEIIAALESLGIGDHTWVIISSDHGELLAKDGASFLHPPRDSYDTLLHVPLIVAGPGLPNGKRVAAMTQNADLVPTLVDYLRLNTDARFEGRSLRAAVESPAESIHEYVYARTQGFSLASEPGRVIILEDAKFDFSPFGDGPFPANAAARPSELVYAMPDTSPGRQIILPDERLRERATEILRTELRPLWQEKDARPVVTPPLFRLQLNTRLSQDSVTDIRDPEDNLWSRERTSVSSEFTSDWMYVASTPTETAPGLIFSTRVPNGTYSVSAYCATLPGDPPRGSSFRYTVRTIDETQRSARLTPSPDGSPRTAYVPLGEYTITDGRFRLWVDTGDPEDNAIIGHLQFVTAGQDSPTSEEVAQREEQLRALGYVE